MYIKEKLNKLKFEKTTPIQEGVFKAFKNKKHLVGLAPTGTGKTHAYLLPMLEQVRTLENQLGAVILVPTNELVIQVAQQIEMTDDTIIYKAYYGGGDKHKEIEWLSKHQPQVLVTTPQRFYDYLYNANVIKSQTVKYLILDEADMMFDYDFLSIIDPILDRLPNAKYLIFSATMSQELKVFVTKYFGIYELVDTSKKHQLKIEYQLINIKYKNRSEMLFELLKTFQPYLAFIFVSKKEDQGEIYEQMSQQGYNVINLNSSLNVKQRKKIIEDIIKLKYQYVVTSDLTARGLDFKISHVIHYDLPNNLEFFQHRSGRTGRMYDDGIVYTFMSVDDHRKIERLKHSGIPFVDYEFTKNGLIKKPKREKNVSDAERKAIQSIKRPTKVKPNYKKKNKALVTKAKRAARRKENDQTR